MIITINYVKEWMQHYEKTINQQLAMPAEMKDILPRLENDKEIAFLYVQIT